MALLYAATWMLLMAGASSLMMDLDRRGQDHLAVDQAPVAHLNRQHFWTTRGGDPFGSRASPFVGPTNFSAGPTWTWNNELDEQVRHSPLIDSHKNIYITTATRIRKFTAEGQILWTHTLDVADGRISASPALYQKAICFFSAVPGSDIHVFSLSLVDGGVNWKNTMVDLKSSLDSGSLSVYNDTLLMPAMDHVMDPNSQDGSNLVVGLSVSDGRKLWQYSAGDILWNFAPSTPGDGTILFATNCGAVHRISYEGELIWKAGRPSPGHWCSCGGGSLGENGVFYNEYNYDDLEKGIIDARRVSDGKLLWSREFEKGYGGWQYPSVGRVGKDRVLAVVVAVGGVTGMPPFQLKNESSSKPLALYNEYLTNSSLREELGVPKLTNAVVAMDATTGEVLWRFEEPAWDHWGANGDEAPFFERVARSADDPRANIFCMPDNQGIPLISGDGFVYASSSHAGHLRSMRDENQDGTITPDEVSTFATHNAFLNAPSLAPGMLVAAPCWGPVYVFQSV